MRNAYAKVFALSGPDKALHYSVPEGMALEPGCLAWVPLQGRRTLAVVLELGRAELPYALKPVTALIYKEPVLTPDLVALITWMKAYYAASIEALCQTFLPAVLRKGLSIKTETFLKACLAPEPEALEALRRRAPKQAALYEMVAQKGPLRQRDLTKDAGIGAGVIAGLVKRGWITQTLSQVQRRMRPEPMELKEPEARLELNKEQAAALKTIQNCIGSFNTVLLHGVTGSGKTEVYLRAIEGVLERGGQALYLVPELALTPQAFARLQQRFPNKSIALWHHQLSEGERLDTHRAASRGEVDIVLGARSAVFVPLPHLELILVDEEHEPSYKQEESPRYHGRDVAVYRAKCKNIPCVLGSATPSSESFLNAQQGRYHYCELTQRARAQSLPRLHLVDMRTELTKEGKPSGPLSRLLLDKLQERLDAGQQSILFINRRGYSRSCLCPQCGFKATCPACSLPLTYHRNDARLRCHLCQHDQEAFMRCPQCQSPKIQWKGLGTQRLEDILKRCFPQARIVRMDADTMSAKDSIGRCLRSLAAGQIDILVGTQLLAKGLDFPKVTLVGLMDADMAFNIPDFRARERGFQLLMQVSGRAGRAQDPGDVVIQTFDPGNRLFDWAKQGDTSAFLRDELSQRKELGYPPYRRLIRHLFLGPDPKQLGDWMQTWAQAIEHNTSALGDLHVLGPAPAALEKCNHNYRYHIWYFTARILDLLPGLLALKAALPLPKGLSERLDVDPVSVL